MFWAKPFFSTAQRTSRRWCVHIY
uniref:Uncharacterized protein n=1 Tax=Anguilla anguilla TaxID=7936 RepID=A0A0E9VZD0_ANGAN